LDRMERIGGVGAEEKKGSAIMEVKKEMGVEVLAILTLDDLIVGVTDEGDRERMLEYRRKYRAIEE